MAVNPDSQELAAFAAATPDEPVIMLNLLRFTDGGRKLYQQYARRFGEVIAPRYGITVVYAGDGESPLVAEAGQEWDAVLLVRYPDRRTFGQMVADPEYQQISHLRTDALIEAVLQPTHPWGTS